MSHCISRHRSFCPATAYLAQRDNTGLEDVMITSPGDTRAIYCQSHAERLARRNNERVMRSQTAGHFIENHPFYGLKLACAMCTPDERRRLRILQEAVSGT